MSPRFFSEPDAEYHKWSGKYMTSHLLIAAFESIGEWRKRMTEPREDSPAFAFGRAVHTLCIEGGDAFNESYIVGGPVNKRTSKTYGQSSKAYQAWAVEQKKTAITPEQFALAKKMTGQVHRHKAAKELLAEGKPEQVARVEYCGLPCQIRVDWITSGKWIVDLKTTSDLFSFGFAVEQYGYMVQAAFYQAITKEVTGELLPYYLIATEKTDEAPCIVWQLSQSKLNRQREKNEQKIAELRSEFLAINERRPDVALIEQGVVEFRHIVLEKKNE